MSIFEWKDGRWHQTAPDRVKMLTPGDPISGNQAVSKYILVDIRKDTRNREPDYAIVMDGNGNLQARTERDDAANPIFAKLKAQGLIAAAGK